MGALEIDVYAELENWARWCRMIGECFPEKWTLNCAGIDEQAIQPKNIYKTVEERLRELMTQEPPPDLWKALKVEYATRGLKRPLRWALKIHYIEMPDSSRLDSETGEQFEERRARIASRRAGWYFSPLMYREAVDRAIDEIEAAL